MGRWVERKDGDAVRDLLDAAIDRDDRMESVSFPCLDEDCLGFCSGIYGWASCFRCGTLYGWTEDEE